MVRVFFAFKEYLNNSDYKMTISLQLLYLVDIKKKIEVQDIRLADGSVITVDRMEDLEKGVYINKDDEYKIVKNNDKDYVWVENQLVEVEGIFKGPSDFIWSMEALGENLTESLYRNSQAISEGSDPMIFSFYSNDKETEKVYENIKKELADNY